LPLSLTVFNNTPNRRRRRRCPMRGKVRQGPWKGVSKGGRDTNASVFMSLKKSKKERGTRNDFIWNKDKGKSRVCLALLVCFHLLNAVAYRAIARLFLSSFCLLLATEDIKMNRWLALCFVFSYSSFSENSSDAVSFVPFAGSLFKFSHQVFIVPWLLLMRYASRFVSVLSSNREIASVIFISWNISISRREIASWTWKRNVSARNHMLTVRIPRCTCRIDRRVILNANRREK